MQNIEVRLAIAANLSDPRQPIYLAFVKAAIAADPCPIHLYDWRQSGSGGSRCKSVFYQKLDGNDVYTLPASFFPQPHGRRNETSASFASFPFVLAVIGDSAAA